ncbi:hypothetical protein QWJ07_27170 [Frankia sp. RB7]|nr:hypothetical protein [Frankia sp. RB7]
MRKALAKLDDAERHQLLYLADLGTGGFGRQYTPRDWRSFLRVTSRPTLVGSAFGL